MTIKNALENFQGRFLLNLALPFLAGWPCIQKNFAVNFAHFYELDT